jgi:hypothetical protein
MEDPMTLIEAGAIISAILNLILLFKIWSMTNDIREMKYQMRKILNNVRVMRGHSYFEYGLNESYEAFEDDMDDIAEMIFCERLEEARYRLKKLEYNLNKMKEAEKQSGYNEKEEMIKKMEEQIADKFKILGKQ